MRKPCEVAHQVLSAGVEPLLARLRSLDAAPVEDVWAAFEHDEWPALFSLIDIGAGLPRLAGHETLARLPAGVWPSLSATAADIVRVQRLVDSPVLPPGTIMLEPPATSEAAVARLTGHQCVDLGSLFDRAGRDALDEAVREMAAERSDAWSAVDPRDGPALHAAMRRGLASESFQRLSAFDVTRHPYQLTLSLQALEPTGIGWHRDLYWPREWVDQDVFAVFHALEDDDPEKGGAFVYYLPWENQVYAFYRRRHHTTVLWNAANTDRRILHAVTGYHGANTRRHLVIAQCLRPEPVLADGTGAGATAGEPR